MLVISDIQETRQLCNKWRENGESIAFVPTMGCLHAGHLSLVEKAHELADRVVVSIFVNPLQFDNPDDLLKYPHTLEEDVRKLTEFNVDLVFSPDVKSFYPEGKDAVQLIELGDITTILEGEKRPGHFAGVATVVKRLFDLVRPNQAIFGDKDFQQVMVIKQLVAQFSLDIEIVTMPTLRENDGLAMSSRNTRLTAEQRAKAPEIYKNLQIIKTALEEGCIDYISLENQSFNDLIAAGFVPEYVVIRDAKNLLVPEKHDEPKSVLIAAKLGDVRLIDNIQV